jgi:hypothetical protein
MRSFENRYFVVTVEKLPQDVCDMTNRYFQEEYVISKSDILSTIIWMKSANRAHERF